jgi:hypothetical protein
MRAEDFDKASIEELQARADKCFELAQSPREGPTVYQILGDKKVPILDDAGKLRLLLEAQFYLTAITKKRDEKVARRDFWMEVGVIVLIGIEIILSIVGIGIGIHEATQQAVEMKAQTGILNEQAKQSALDSSDAAKRTEKQLDLAQKQVGAAQDSVKAIQRQMTQDQRPWVSLNLNWPSVKGPKGEPLGTLVQVTENEPLSVPVQITNTGKTAARNVHASMFVDVVKTDEEPRLNSSKDRAWKFESGTLFPNTPSGFLAYRQEPNKNALEAFSVLTPTENQELKNGQAYLSIHGEIKYEDVFRNHHWTKFCFWFPMTLAPKYYTAQDCAKYNGVDNN